MNPDNKDWIAETVKLLDTFLRAATLPRAAVALALAACFYFTNSWPAVPMFTIGCVLLVGTIAKWIESRRSKPSSGAGSLEASARQDPKGLPSEASPSSGAGSQAP